MIKNDLEMRVNHGRRTAAGFLTQQPNGIIALLMLKPCRRADLAHPFTQSLTNREKPSYHLQQSWPAHSGLQLNLASTQTRLPTETFV